MSWFTREKLSPRHILLPLLYLSLGMAVGYVFPVLFGWRMGKGEVEEWKERDERLRVQWGSDLFTGRLAQLAYDLQKQGCFVLEDWDTGIDAGWIKKANGEIQVNQNWSFRLKSPPIAQMDPARKAEVEKAFLNFSQKGLFLSIQIKDVLWEEPDKISVGYQWTFQPGKGRYQTTNFWHELSW